MNLHDAGVSIDRWQQPDTVEAAASGIQFGDDADEFSSKSE